jgi:hypothetical protein
MSDKFSSNDQLYLQASYELEKQGRDEALWVKSYALENGDINSAKARYIRERVARLEQLAASKDTSHLHSEVAKAAVNRGPGKNFIEDASHAGAYLGGFIATAFILALLTKFNLLNIYTSIALTIAFLAFIFVVQKAEKRANLRRKLFENRAIGEGGLTELMVTAGLGDVQKTVSLIEKGASINAIDNTGSTALIYAAIFSEPEVIEILLKGGADPSIIAKDKRSASSIAKDNGDFAINNLINSYQTKGS